jgi:hypothetical protein
MGLFTPAWMSDNHSRASNAVTRIKDPGVLARVAREAPSECARMAAIEKITDQALLAQIACSDSLQRVREKACRHIHNDGALADVALHGKDNAAVYAADKIVDQRQLARVAQEACSASARAVAIKRLRDQGVLSVIVTDRNGMRSLRQAALENLTDTAALSQLAMDEEDILGDFRRAALARLQDQTLFKKIASEDGSQKMREFAIGYLTDETALLSLPRSGKTLPERWLAADRLGNPTLMAELQTHAEQTVNGHKLVTIAHREWEYHEDFCLVCGKTGGRRDDEESTRHYGCNFRMESCRPRRT